VEKLRRETNPKSDAVENLMLETYQQRRQWIAPDSGKGAPVNVVLQTYPILAHPYQVCFLYFMKNCGHAGEMENITAASLHQLFSSPKPLQTCSYMLMKLIII
jgi:hypothetical protein